MEVNRVPASMPQAQKPVQFQPLNEEVFKADSNMPDSAVEFQPYSAAYPPLIEEFLTGSESVSLAPSSLQVKKKVPNAISTDLFPKIVPEAALKPREWTVLFYLNGNCDLQDDMEKDLKTIEKVGSDEKIAFVAQIARADRNGEAERVFLKKPSMLGLKKNSVVVEELGPTNMAHPQTLKNFLTWGMREYPAKHYMVVLSGHGMGFLGSLPDSTANNDVLLTPELASALNVAKKETGNQIDILGMDSCLMANAETAYAAKDTVNFLVGSEEVLAGENWDYDHLATRMKEEVHKDGLTVAETLEEMVKSQLNYDILTSSIIDCRYMPQFAEKLNTFAERLLAQDVDETAVRRAFRKAQHYCQPHIMEAGGASSQNTEPMDQMRDISSLAAEIIISDDIVNPPLKEAALDLMKFVKDKGVIFEVHRKNVGLDQSGGMAIYAPTSGSENYVDYYHDSVSLARDTRWGEVVEKFGA